MSTVRACVVLILLLLVTAVLLPIQQIIILFAKRRAGSIPRLWHRIAGRLLGLRIHVHGAPANGRPLLITSNHASWLDIVVLSNLMQVSFIAKLEVKSWPVFGTFAVLQRTVFVNRERRSETGKVTNEIAQRLTDGDPLVLFAEGTSSTGNQILPFKTALFGGVTMALEEGRQDSGSTGGTKAYIQPMSIAYTRLAGLPMGRQFRTTAAWYGDMSLAPHVWTVLREGAIDVECAWGPPVVYETAADRKVAARQSEATVRRNMSALLTGRYNELSLGHGDVHRPVHPGPNQTNQQKNRA